MDSVPVSLFVTRSELTPAGRTKLLVHGRTNMDFQFVGLTKQSWVLDICPQELRMGGKAPNESDRSCPDFAI